MKKPTFLKHLILIILTGTITSVSLTQDSMTAIYVPESTYNLKDTSQLELTGITAVPCTYKGIGAVRIEPASDNTDGRKIMIAKLKNNSFKNGTIEVDLVGKPGENAPEGSRGFVGIAFRVSEDNSKFECIYLRPTNARAEDQLRRNHSTQYMSFPEYPWYRLRRESPGKYESYVDLIPGEWTKVKIEVDNSIARLYVNESDQPALIVSDLKLGPEQSGGIALWIATGTEAYFSNMTITHEISTE